MKIRMGWILGIAGGLVTIAGAALPWATVTGGTLAAPETFSGLRLGFGGIAVLILGLLGLVCIAIPRRVTALLALVCGILALGLGLLTLLVISSIAGMAGASGSGVTVTTEYGVYFALSGTLVLLVGAAIKYMSAKKADALRVVAAPPMSPPSG